MRTRGKKWVNKALHFFRIKKIVLNKTATSKTWTRTLKTWTLKNLDLEKHGKRLDMEK